MPFSHTTRLSLLTKKPLITAMTRKEPIRIMSIFLRTVHNARNRNIDSTMSCETVLKGPITSGPQIRSLTKPVHVASQKPMKKSLCKMNRISNFMILAVVGER